MMAAASLVFDHDLVRWRSADRNRSTFDQTKDVGPFRTFSNYEVSEHACLSDVSIKDDPIEANRCATLQISEMSEIGA